MLTRNYPTFGGSLIVVREDRNSKAEFAFLFNDDEPSDLGVCVFVVFDSRKICIIVGGVQPVNGIGTRRLSEEDRKDLSFFKKKLLPLTKKEGSSDS